MCSRLPFLTVRLCAVMESEKNATHWHSTYRPRYHSLRKKNTDLISIPATKAYAKHLSSLRRKTPKASIIRLKPSLRYSFSWAKTIRYHIGTSPPKPGPNARKILCFSKVSWRLISRALAAFVDGTPASAWVLRAVFTCPRIESNKSTLTKKPTFPSFLLRIW